jgi:hypothetical protein
MHTLQKYITRELLRGFLISFLVLMLIIFVGFALQYIHQGLDIIQVRFIFPHLAMQSFPYSIPLSLLIAVIMTFGRLSGDNEITAMRSSGIHLQVVVTPTLLVKTTYDYDDAGANGHFMREQGLFGGTATGAKDFGPLIDVIHHPAIWKDETIRLVRFIQLMF